jgi:superfamily II DNA helicase RecQ
MNDRIFSLSAAGDDTGEQVLNAFRHKNKVINVDRQFVAQGDSSYWRLCVSYQPASIVEQQNRNGKKPKIDDKEVLTELQFSHFSAFRDLRAKMTAQDCVPFYAVFTNAQLADMVQQQVQTAAQLKAIEGVGESKLERYGEVFLQYLQQRAKQENA